jgi:hypothetical protein
VTEVFRHVVMFRWADGVDDMHVQAVGAGLDALVDAIPQIRRYHHGPDVGVNDGNFDYVVVGDFDSVEDYLVYRDHPVHLELIRTLIAGRVSERAAVQYEIGA